MLMNPITDPAVRLSDEFVGALIDRYKDRSTIIDLDPDDYSARYASICDLVCQLLWPEKYRTEPEDLHLHTSDPARTIAGLIMTVAGLQPQFGERPANPARPVDNKLAPGERHVPD